MSCTNATRHETWKSLRLLRIILSEGVERCSKAPNKFPDTTLRSKYVTIVTMDIAELIKFVVGYLQYRKMHLSVSRKTINDAK